MKSLSLTDSPGEDELLHCLVSPILLCHLTWTTLLIFSIVTVPVGVTLVVGQDAPAIIAPELADGTNAV